MAAAILSSRRLHDGWAKLDMAEVRLDDGQVVRREIESHGDAAAVLAYDPDRRTALLVRQLRPALLSRGVLDRPAEAIAGLLDDDDPETCARREAMEETGVALRALEPAGVCWSMPGISTERMHLFLAAYAEADRTGAGGGVAGEHEQIEVLELPLATLRDWADQGELADMKTFALVQTLRLRRPDLFQD